MDLTFSTYTPAKPSDSKWSGLQTVSFMVAASALGWIIFAGLVVGAGQIAGLFS